MCGTCEVNTVFLKFWWLGKLCWEVYHLQHVLQPASLGGELSGWADLFVQAWPELGRELDCTKPGFVVRLHVKSKSGFDLFCNFFEEVP